MKIYLWQLCHSEHWNNIVLWDGENTYWCDLMRPSGGYKKMNTRTSKFTNSKFTYMGEL